MGKVISVFLLWLAGIVAGAQFSKFSLVIDVLQSSFHIDALYSGWLLSSLGMMGIIFGATAGVFVARYCPFKLVIYSLVMASIISFSQVLFLEPAIMLFIRFIEGITQLLLVTAAPTAILQVSLKEYQSLAMALWGTFFGVAFAISNAVGPSIIEIWSWKGVFFSHSLLAAVTALSLLFLFPQFGSTGTPAPQTGQWNSFIRAHFKVYSGLSSALPGFIFGVHTFMFLLFLTYMPKFFNYVFPDQGQLLHILSVSLPTVSLIGTFLSGTVTKRIGSSPLITINIVFAGMIALLVGCIFSTNEVVLFILASAVLLCAGLIQGLVFILIPYLGSSQEDHAKANGAVSQLGNLGATLGVPIFAWILIRTHWNIAMLFPVFCCLLGICVTTMGRRRWLTRERVEKLS